MILAYHVIFGAYGFWMPNDPRGTWSDFVGSWDLYHFGHAKPHEARAELSEESERRLLEMKRSLKFSAVQFNGPQAQSIGTGFGIAAKKSKIKILRCSILPQHVHLIIAYHQIKIRYLVGMLKGEATKQMERDRRHPLSGHVDRFGQTPTPWNVKCWTVYLDDNVGISNAIRYVDANPIKEGKPRQVWGFEHPFQLLDE